MQLPWDEHFLEIVIPAWQAYLAAEKRLSAEIASASDLVHKARYEALREGGAVSFYLHHYGEVVLRAKPSWLPEEVQKPAQMIEWLSSFCTMLRTDKSVEDVALLRDIADALKHAVLTRNLDERQIAANEAILVLPSGWGLVGFGEGKWGGVEQVLVKTVDRHRPLTSVLQNVVDAWRRASGLPLPPIGQP